jgi:predicted MPP superfamily phosphohydrolase
LAAGVVAAGVGTLAYSVLYERTRWTLRRFTVPVLPPGAAPLTVLHVSDLHLTPGQRSKQEWVRGLAEHRPDLVVVTGDNLAHPAAVPALLHTLEPFRINSDRPGLLVWGSNDYFGPRPKNPFMYFNRHHRRRLGVPLPWGEMRDALVGAGWLDTTHARHTVKVGGLAIEVAGVDDPHLKLDRYDEVAGPVTDLPVDLRLGLVHAPEPRVLDRFVADGYELLLCGHTHGGQVCVPYAGALVTNCGLDRGRAKGLHRYGPAWLHVSAGLGTNPYTPVRFACPPEASLLTLVPRAATPA